MNFKERLNENTIRLVQEFLKPYLSPKEKQKFQRELMRHNTQLINHEERKRQLAQDEWLNKKIYNALNPNA